MPTCRSATDRAVDPHRHEWIPVLTKCLQVDETGDGVIMLTMNRPERLNALSGDLIDDLHSVFTLLREHPEVRVLGLPGDGRGFCASLDLANCGSN